MHCNCNCQTLEEHRARQPAVQQYLLDSMALHILNNYQTKIARRQRLAKLTEAIRKRSGAECAQRYFVDMRARVIRVHKTGIGNYATG